MIRDNVVGGPALVFHRHAKVGETKIFHNGDVGPSDNDLFVKSIMGFDANALYLWAFAKKKCLLEIFNYFRLMTVSGTTNPVRDGAEMLYAGSDKWNWKPSSL